MHYLKRIRKKMFLAIVCMLITLYSTNYLFHPETGLICKIALLIILVSYTLFIILFYSSFDLAPEHHRELHVTYRHEVIATTYFFFSLLILIIQYIFLENDDIVGCIVLLPQSLLLSVAYCGVPWHKFGIQMLRSHPTITLGIILTQNDKVLLFYDRKQDDWLIPGTLSPALKNLDEIPYYIKMCNLAIKRTNILGVYPIDKEHYMVTIHAETIDNYAYVQNSFDAQWIYISELRKYYYPMKPGQRTILEDALSKIYLNN